MARGTNYSAYETLTVAGSSVGFTVGSISGMEVALVTCEGGAVRFRLDGTAPTASVGHELRAGDTMECDSSEMLENIRFIRKTGQSGTLRCSYGF